MKFTFQPKGNTPVGVIRQYDNKRKKRVLYYTDDKTDATAFKKFELEEDEYFTPVPLLFPAQRVALNITGGSGSGKSLLLSRILKEFNKLHKLDTNILISAGRDDPAFDDLPHLPVDVMSTIEMGEFTGIGEFANSNTIFDDFNNFPSEEENKFVHSIMLQLLERSRKQKTNLFIINHDARDFNKTKLLLIEATGFIIFPNTNSNSARKLLTNYLDLSKAQIEEILNSEPDDRFAFCYICRNPKYYITNRYIKML